MFDGDVVEQIKTHMLQVAPLEGCGFVVRQVAGVRFFACTNAAEKPQEDFLLDAADFVRASQHGEIVAVVHSHVDKPLDRGPSLHDMLGQVSSGLMWGLVSITHGQVQGPAWWGPGVPLAPYIGRPFVHGIWDCYQLVVDFYQQDYGIKLPHIPREFGWWERGENMLEEGFAAAGFSVVSTPELGDVVFARVGRFPVANHSGVYIGNGLVLHHLTQRLSRREPLAPWLKLVTHFLHHKER